MDFTRDGAQRFRGALDGSALAVVEAALASLPMDRAGVRLYGVDALRPILVDGVIGTLAAALLGAGSRPVRAVLFDKSAATNWALGWHQDRTIAVVEKVAAPGFRAWNRKGDILHVEPPFELLERMVTLRVHLDPVAEDNAPLLIAPGSHRLGRVPEAEVPSAVERCGIYACLAERGDVWAYATPIIHASEAARQPTRRRVLQIDYAAEELPFGLRWQGI